MGWLGLLQCVYDSTSRPWSGEEASDIVRCNWTEEDLGFDTFILSQMGSIVSGWLSESTADMFMLLIKTEHLTAHSVLSYVYGKLQWVTKQ